MKDRFKKYVSSFRPGVRKEFDPKLWIVPSSPLYVTKRIEELQKTHAQGSPAAAKAAWLLVEEVFVRGGMSDQLVELEKMMGMEQPKQSDTAKAAMAVDAVVSKKDKAND